MNKLIPKGKVIFRTPSYTKVCEIVGGGESTVKGKSIIYSANDNEKTLYLKPENMILNGTHVSLWSYFWEEYTVKGAEPEIGVTIIVIDKD